MEGLAEGDAVDLVVWDASGDVVVPSAEVNVRFKAAFSPSGGFQPDALYIVASNTPVADFPGPEAALVGQPFPNPAVSRARLPLTLRESATVYAELYDVRGRRVAVPFDGRLSAGAHTIPLDVSALAAGTYLYRLTIGAEVSEGHLAVSR